MYHYVAFSALCKLIIAPSRRVCHRVGRHLLMRKCLMSTYRKFINYLWEMHQLHMELINIYILKANVTANAPFAAASGSTSMACP